MKIDTIIMVGRSGSGKGTQARLLSKKTGFEIFSTGDKFREAKQKDNSLGKLINDFYEAGNLFPYWFAGYFFMDVILNAPLEKGFILEGSSRSKEEAVLIDEVLAWLGREYIAVNLEISDEEVARRLKNRERGDTLGEPEKIKKRLEWYESRTAKAIEYYREKGNILDVNGEQTPEEVHKEVLSKLDRYEG